MFSSFPCLLRIFGVHSQEEIVLHFEVVKKELLNLAPRELSERLREMHNQNLLRTFLMEAVNDRALRAHLSYWEKWYGEPIRKLIDEIMSHSEESGEGSLPLHLEQIYSKEQLRIIFSSLGAIQLTFGCSKNCPMCGIDAVPGVREQFPYPVLRNMFESYGALLTSNNNLSRPILYWASDPSDYQWSDGTQNYTYQDVHALARRFGKYTPHLTTKEYRREDWIKFLRKHPDKRLSVHGVTEEQAAAIRQAVVRKAKKDEGKEKERTRLVGIGVKQVTGIGISIVKDQSHIGKRGIGCFNGLLLTPRGLYNLFQVPISRRFPQGHIVVPLENITDTPVGIGDSLMQIMREKVLFVDFIIDDADKDKGYAEPILRWGGKYYSLKVGPDFRVMAVNEYDLNPEVEVIEVGEIDSLEPIELLEQPMPLDFTQFTKLETINLQDLMDAQIPKQPFAQQAE
jgi:hypothetical protein